MLILTKITSNGTFICILSSTYLSGLSVTAFKRDHFDLRANKLIITVLLLKTSPQMTSQLTVTAAYIR